MATVLALPREWYRRDCRCRRSWCRHPPDSGDAVPADGPAYGVNNSTFQRLWSDDVDNGNLSVDDFDDANVIIAPEFAHRLARSTDVPFARPPQATSNWIAAISAITVLVVVGVSPPDRCVPEDGVYIKDAYVGIFAHSPRRYFTARTGTTQYVAPDGQGPHDQ